LHRNLEDQEMLSFKVFMAMNF